MFLCPLTNRHRAFIRNLVQGLEKCSWSYKRPWICGAQTSVRKEQTWKSTFTKSSQKAQPQDPGRETSNKHPGRDHTAWTQGKDSRSHRRFPPETRNHSAWVQNTASRSWGPGSTIHTCLIQAQFVQMDTETKYRWCHAMGTCLEWEVSGPRILNSALDRHKWSASCLGFLVLEKSVPFELRVGVSEPFWTCWWRKNPVTPIRLNPSQQGHCQSPELSCFHNLK
jgi:hypothetical protein